MAKKPLGKKYLVRKCKIRETPRLIELLKKTGLLWKSGDTIDAFQKKLIHDPESILVLDYGGKIIGMVVFIYDPWASFLWHLTIDPQYQGRGLGHMLIHEAEKLLEKRGTTSSNGFVMPANNHSRSFLKKRGYREAIWHVIAVEKIFKF